MTFLVADRVQQTGTANTTVSFTMTGSVAGYQSWSAVGNGNTTYYGASDSSGNWEVGLATYSTTGPTVTRTTIFASSNAGAAVTFSGTVNVWVDYPATKAVYLDASSNVSPLGTITSGTWNAGVIPVTYGGTNSTATPTNGGVVYGTGTAMAVTAAGTSGQVLQSNGASPPSWVAVPSGGFSNMQVFTAPGAFTTPASTTRIKVTVVGGGGGSNSAPSASAGGAGGASIYVGAITASTPYPITVGSAGAAGGSGGTSSFSTLASATGGTNTNTGGTGSAGTLNIIGGQGSGSLVSVVTPNPITPSSATTAYSSIAGGSSIFGNKGGFGGGAPFNGGSTSPGSPNPAATNGQAGTAGVVIVEW